MYYFAGRHDSSAERQVGGGDDVVGAVANGEGRKLVYYSLRIDLCRHMIRKHIGVMSRMFYYISNTNNMLIWIKLK